MRMKRIAKGHKTPVETAVAMIAPPRVDANRAD